MSQFKNLERLNLEYLSDEAVNILGDLPNLKQISINEFRNTNFAKNLIKQMRILRRLDFYYGLNVDKNEEIEILNEHLENNGIELPIKYYMDNYLKLADSLTWVYLNYSNLIKLIDEIPADFYDKFCKIRRIGVYEKVDQQNFINFLANNYLLKELNLKNTGFNQTFYNQLKFTSPLVKSIKIEENDTVINNFDFISQFDYVELKVNQELPIDFIKWLINCKSSILLSFKLNDQTIEINFRRIIIKIFTNSIESEFRFHNFKAMMNFLKQQFF